MKNSRLLPRIVIHYLNASMLGQSTCGRPGLEEDLERIYPLAFGFTVLRIVQ